MFWTFEKKYFKAYVSAHNSMKKTPKPNPKKTCKKNTDESHNKNLKLLTVEPACIYGGRVFQALKTPHWNCSWIYQISVLQASSMNIFTSYLYNSGGD